MPPKTSIMSVEEVVIDLVVVAGVFETVLVRAGRELGTGTSSESVVENVDDAVRYVENS